VKVDVTSNHRCPITNPTCQTYLEVGPARKQVAEDDEEEVRVQRPKRGTKKGERHVRGAAMSSIAYAFTPTRTKDRCEASHPPSPISPFPPLHPTTSFDDRANAPLVDLVEDDVGDALERRVELQPPQQDACETWERRGLSIHSLVPFNPSHPKPTLNLQSPPVPVVQKRSLVAASMARFSRRIW
jgi:hypothetical protein